MEKKIVFGTDGWRGIIADDFTFKNVRYVAQAVADYLKDKGSVCHKSLSPKVIVGYDRRFMSDKFALAAARVMSGNGFKVILSDKPLPTQALSYSVINNKAIIGIMITASHNPPSYNGFKIKLQTGASADKDVTNRLEKLLFKNEPRDNNKIEYKDLIPEYLSKVRSMLDMDVIRRAKLKVVHNAMFGVGAGLLEQLLKGSKCKVTNMNTYHDPNFGGIHPEPIKKNLLGLIEEVKKQKADIGVATDGDADRVAIIDDTGRYLTPHHVFPLLLYYLCQGRKMKGKVVQTVSLGYLSERIAKAYGLPFQEVAVGFKYIAQIMLSEDMLIGGEESGGYSMKGYIPDRDGFLNALLFIEMVTKEKKKISQILNEIEKKFGRSCFDRIDVRMDIDLKGRNFKDEFTKAIFKNTPLKIAGMKVNELRTKDGAKFMLGSKAVVGSEAWLLMRPSGTEPLVRIYAEAGNPARMKEILKAGNAMVKNCFK